MTPEQFCYWLQGYFELTDEELGTEHQLTYKQMTVVREHLGKVFNKAPELLNDVVPLIDFNTQFKHHASC